MPLAPSAPPSVQVASSALESSLKSFLSKQRKKRVRKQEGGHELSSIEERSLQEQERVATRAARHGSHILKVLAVKRQALSLGVSALDDCTDQCLAALEHDAAWCVKDNLQRILEHFFTNYLRLRDGLVLLTSGECRHPGDSRQAAKADPRYKSSFGTDSTTRGDGYTALFSAKGGYSGAGWDEFYDENLGVRTRLVDACLGCAGAKPVPSKGWGGNRAKVWNRLCEIGAEVFESELDLHDTETAATKAQLETLRRRFLDGINGILFRRAKDGSGGRLGGKLVMVTTDKFERIELQNAAAIGISSLVIERQGDNFCISDDSGVLPSDWDQKAWKEAMALPNELRESQLATGGPKKGNSTKPEKRIPSMEPSSAALPKKRRVIVENSESDSDEEGRDVAKKGKTPIKRAQTTGAPAGAPAAPATHSASIGGLRVKVKTIDDASSSPTNSDINQIKSSLGVDVDALARGCDELDAEQKRSASAAVAEEAATATGMHAAAFMSSAAMQDEEESSRINELLENVAELREEMRAGENILRLVNKSKAEDLWDARESLREIKMTLGICLLELHFAHRGRSSRTTLLFAESLFSDASDLVSHQFNDLEAATIAEDVSTRHLMRQGLFLLRGRAETNRGIVLIELAKFEEGVESIMNGKKANKANTLLKSIQHLRKAVDDARSLRAKAALSVSSDSACNSEISKADQHLCDARVLETLATRRHGEALWLLGQWKNGAQKFEEAAGFEHDEEEMSSAASSATQLETYLAFLVERYYAATSLVDHAAAALEKVPFGKASSTGEDVKSMAIKGYNFAESISGIVFNLTEHQVCSYNFEEIKEERDLLSKDELLNAKADFEKWWEEKKSTASSTTNDRSRMNSRLRLSSTGVDREYLTRSRLPSHPPTTRVTVSATGGKVGSSNRSSKSSNATRGPSRVLAPPNSALKSSSGSTAGQDRFQGMSNLCGDSASAHSETQIAYRKWGDALLPQIKYPACAPELTFSTRN
mmetsp:Transcript_16006/g.34818  ORF Transcript_16006/g.34818 Transcript_16006/m.34818 type:complete len:995 (-) Transcript_16006:215-3199(-)